MSSRRKNGEIAVRLLQNVRRAEMLRAGESVAVAVSGGADSVALLLLLLELRDELGIVLSVVHLNHKLRGKASDADEKFVARLAANLGLPFHTESADVARKARREKANLEDAARRARYDFFSRVVAQAQADLVAVAQTMDDQAETVLAHILRGTGLAGLAGIHPRTMWVVRPLLGVRRTELREYLRAKKQKWREDATNQDTTRTRARIRKKLLPLLARQFQPAVVEHLVSLAEFAREDEEFLEQLARERCEALAKKGLGGKRIAVADLLFPMAKSDFNAEFAEDAVKEEKSCALTKRMLLRLIDECKSGTGQITARHIAAVLDLARRGQNGKSLQLSGGAEVRREHHELVFLTQTFTRINGRNRAQKISAADYEHKIDFRNGDVSLRVPQAGCVFRLRVIDWLAKRVDTKESGAVLDRDRLRSPLVLRNWRPGDKLQPVGHQKPHKLKRLLNEKRVSRWERAGWPVVTSGGVLVWARGFPAAAGFAANDETRTGILIAEENT
ncbi:MAG TPA: tRNA lysidine(34) synthetase TilS [Candidatus Solibacter sp.]|nr:tRNA lysidine(34) synthetase TilS [Candidatus Solibacter sp.]